jgi:multiple sugar transport system ATP-binding protein
MGRAIARHPKVYLMDEPLSNLDAKLRVRVRADLAQLHAQLGVTTVYVTHDQVEAMTLGQRAAVMNRGQIQQVDSPQRLYWSPTNLFVAAFIGSPSMNLAEGKVSGGVLDIGGFSLPLSELGTNARRLPSTVILGVRPEHLTELTNGAAAGWALEGEVAVQENLGAEELVFFPLEIAAVESDDLVRAHSGEEHAALLADERAIFTARLVATGVPRERRRIKVGLDPNLCHFFDPETGDAIAVRDGA